MFFGLLKHKDIFITLLMATFSSANVSPFKKEEEIVLCLDCRSGKAPKY